MEIRPFRGWRYQPGPDGDVSDFLAPPYDVLSPADKQELLARSDRNIVAVDLPHAPAREVGPEEAYRDAAARFAHWKASGVLRQDPRPSLYVAEQTFSWGGRHHVRRALLCGVRATELGRDVIPHEHTFAGVKADRLKLTEYTRTQLSPIFGFYHDPQEQVSGMLRVAAERPAAAHGSLGGVGERLWVVEDPQTIEALRSVLRDVPVFIADGHHRYATGVTYRDALRAAWGIDANHEANFVLFALVARDDAGLKILPTHRIIHGMKRQFTIHKLIQCATQFSWTRCSVEDADLENADAFLRRYGRGAMAFMGSDPAEVWVARLTDPTAMAAAARDQCAEWRRLDVAILHKLIIDKALETWRTPDLFIEYTPDGRSVLAACRSGRAQLGICLQATPLDAVEAIARTGQTMPHKSTYFYPKPATGMVLKPLD